MRLDRAWSCVPRLGSTLALALGLAGCVTAGEGEALRTDINRLSERLEVMEKRDVEAKEQVARLRKILDEATALLTRNNADVGARVAQHETDIADTRGKLEELKYLLEQMQKKSDATEARFAALEQTQAKIVDRVAPTMPDDKETLWREAQSRMASGSREDGRRFFRAFVQRFPQDPRGAEAQVQLGRSFALEGKHTQAAAEYQRVLDAYKTSPQAPEAMFLLGQSFVELKFCGDAQALFKELSRRYPKSPRASESKLRVKELQRLLKDKRVCTS